MTGLNHRSVHVVTAMLVGTVVLGHPSSASAAWSARGTGSGAAAATVMPAGSAPSASVTRTSVLLTWGAATMADGGSVGGYLVSRFNESTGAPATVGAACSGVITATSCTEQSVPAGTWVYTDTPVEGTWAGAQSPDSAPVVVS